jgi:hypothetical protein
MENEQEPPEERRQGGDRRKKRRYRYNDRRSGYERRRAGLRMGVVKRTLYVLHDKPRTLLWVLVATNALNVVDFLFTLVALDAGGREANPLLRPLFALDPLVAGLFKVVLVLAATLIVWRSRYYMLAVIAGVFMLVLFGGLIVYHVVLMAMLG